MLLIIGLNAYHGDSSACLVRDGVIVAAAEEERFRRIKHWAGFPSQAIAYCLAEAGVKLSEVDVVAVNSDPSASFLKKIEYTLRQRPDFRFIADRLRNQTKRQSIEAELAQQRFPGHRFEARSQRVEHHLSHLASAFLVSPFEEACVASVDGFGDFSSAAWGVGRDSAIDIEGRVYFPHSLGVFYQALTQYLGFPHYGDEYKVMGLAPYGQPEQLAQMRQIVRLKDGGSFEIDHALLPASQAKRSTTPGRAAARTSARFSRRARGTAWASAQAGRAAGAEAPRYRPLGPGDVRGGILPPPQPSPREAPARQPDACRWLRHELGGQRQGARADAVQARSTCSRRRATPGGAIGAAL